MAITDEDRNHLFNTLRETLGARDAARMMELLPPVGWSDVARQRDVDRRFDEIDRRFDEIDRRFDEIDRRFSDLPQIFATKDDLRAQTHLYIGWMVASNTALVAALALVLSLR